MQNLLTGLRFTRAKTAQAAGTADVESDVIDMANFDSVIFGVLHGTITDGTPDVKVQQGDESDLSDAADLEGTRVAVADDDDDSITLVEVRRPSKRYVRCVVDRDGATGSVVDAIIAVQGFPRELPVTQDATVSGAEIHSSPAEGTA